ncbi:MAG: hypothetical protein QOG97_3138 [Acidimicrobiaceae bacterium]|nr:hypothetical protein [Acidimicrobiaceae bacterium]
MPEAEGERITRAEFAECIDLILTDVTTTDPGRPVAPWRPSIELSQGVNTIWHALDGIEGLDPEEERLFLSVYNDYDDLSAPDLVDQREAILRHLRFQAWQLKDHVGRRA